MKHRHKTFRISIIAAFDSHICNTVSMIEFE